jgi:hypothetical protein
MKNDKVLAVALAFLMVGQTGAVDTTTNREENPGRAKARVYLRAKIDQGDSVHKIAQDLLHSRDSDQYLGIWALSDDRSFMPNKDKLWLDDNARQEVKDADMDLVEISILASDVLEDYNKNFRGIVNARGLKEVLDDEVKHRIESAEAYLGGHDSDGAEYALQTGWLKGAKELAEFKKPEAKEKMAELKSKLEDIRSKEVVSDAEKAEKNEDIRIFENTIKDLASVMSDLGM